MLLGSKQVQAEDGGLRTACLRCPAADSTETELWCQLTADGGQEK